MKFIFTVSSWTGFMCVEAIRKHRERGREELCSQIQMSLSLQDKLQENIKAPLKWVLIALLGQLPPNGCRILFLFPEDEVTLQNLTYSLWDRARCWLKKNQSHFKEHWCFSHWEERHKKRLWSCWCVCVSTYQPADFHVTVISVRDQHFNIMLVRSCFFVCVFLKLL